MPGGSRPPTAPSSKSAKAAPRIMPKISPATCCFRVWSSCIPTISRRITSPGPRCTGIRSRPWSLTTGSSPPAASPPRSIRCASGARRSGRRRRAGGDSRRRHRDRARCRPPPPRALPSSSLRGADAERRRGNESVDRSRGRPARVADGPHARATAVPRRRQAAGLLPRQERRHDRRRARRAVCQAHRLPGRACRDEPPRPRPPRPRPQRAFGESRRHHRRSRRGSDPRRRGARRVSDHGGSGAGAARSRRSGLDGGAQSRPRRLACRQHRNAGAGARRRARRAVVGLRSGKPADGGVASAAGRCRHRAPSGGPHGQQDSRRGGRVERPRRNRGRKTRRSHPRAGRARGTGGEKHMARRSARGMSWIARAFRVLTARSRLIGPGRLVLVVGPSGAGKDTLIARARAACRGDATVVFPRSEGTRPPSIFEDNEFMPPSAFEQAAANGAFAIWWSAHGHMYGIPLAIDFYIEAGRTVVCNVSRTVVAAVRERYANVVTVLVTAPREVLGSRLASRERASDASIADRMNRATLADGKLRPDVIINNVGEAETAARKLVDTLYATGVFAG